MQSSVNSTQGSVRSVSQFRCFGCSASKRFRMRPCLMRHGISRTSKWAGSMMGVVGGMEISNVGLSGRRSGGGRRKRSVGFGAKGQQQSAGSVDGAQGVGMVRRQLQQCPRLQSLPMSAEQEIAVPAEDLDERAPAVGVLGELLTGGEGKKHHANRRGVEQGTTHDPALGKLEQVGQHHSSGRGGVQWNGTRHDCSIAHVKVWRVDAGQDWDRNAAKTALGNRNSSEGMSSNTYHSPLGFAKLRVAAGDVAALERSDNVADRDHAFAVLKRGYTQTRTIRMDDIRHLGDLSGLGSIRAARGWPRGSRAVSGVATFRS